MERKCYYEETCPYSDVCVERGPKKCLILNPEGGESMTKPKIKPIYSDVFGATVWQDYVVVDVPHSLSPYDPIWVGVTDKFLTLTVWDEELGLMEKKFEYRDLLIMHKALTRIFGKKPKRKRKA